jgi:phosphosulfolactate phosphohydrolase-like enzyme
MLKEIIAGCIVNHQKSINILCGHNAEILIIKAGGKYSYHCVLNGKTVFSYL